MQRLKAPLAVLLLLGALAFVVYRFNTSFGPPAPRNASGPPSSPGGPTPEQMRKWAASARPNDASGRPMPPKPAGEGKAAQPGGKDAKAKGGE